MSSDRFQIPCPGCGTKVAVSMAHVGKKGRCPSCKTVFPINAPAAEPIVAELMPVSTPGLQPIASPGLQPLGNSGLQPLGSQPFGSQPWPQNPQPAAWAGSAIPNPYGNSAQPSPFGQPASPFGQAPAASFGQSGSPFGQSPTGDDDLRLAPAANPYAAPATPASSFNFAPAKPHPSTDDGTINGSLWGGMGLMALAVVWFVGGLFFDIIFFYPPILFILGLIAFVKGLVNLGSNR